MNILFTNQRLFRFGGSQGVIRDLASGLRKRGHAVLAYSSTERLPEEPFALDSVPTTAQLNTLPFVPDLIHAHHQLDAMTAIMALPGVPAVYCCHGATRGERQPRHPRIVRYVAMSPTLRLRMATESGIDENLIHVVYNAVDLDRFRVMRDPPLVPRRALVYRRNINPDSMIGREIRKAATIAGLELEFRGIGPGLTLLPNPEEVLPDFDIVFTSGKSAIDALACGCAVIVVVDTSCGEMVREANFDQLRRANFSPAVNSAPPSVARIVGEIKRYSAVEVAATSRRLRDVAGLDGYVEQLLAIYEEVLDAWEHAIPDLRAEQRAAAGFLRSIVPWMDMVESGHGEPFGGRLLRDALSRQMNATSMAR